MQHTVGRPGGNANAFPADLIRFFFDRCSAKAVIPLSRSLARIICEKRYQHQSQQRLINYHTFICCRSEYSESYEVVVPSLPNGNLHGRGYFMCRNLIISRGWRHGLRHGIEVRDVRKSRMGSGLQGSFHSDYILAWSWDHGVSGSIIDSWIEGVHTRNSYTAQQDVIEWVDMRSCKIYSGSNRVDNVYNRIAVAIHATIIS